MFILDITKVIDLVIAVFILLFLSFIKSAIALKKKKRIDNNREKAIKIIEQFENLLSKKNIKIPSEDREDNEDETCIYGTEYYELEDAIVEILDNKN